MVPDWGWDKGKAGTYTIKVKMVAEGSAGTKRAISLARKKEKDWLGGDSPKECKSLRISHFEKEPSSSHTQN